MWRSPYSVSLVLYPHILVYRSVLIHHVYALEPVLLAQLVVVRVVGWRYLERSCAKLHIHVLVRNH